MVAKQTPPEDIEVDEEDGGGEGAHVEFDIASYPSDLTLNVIHEMWKAEDITIPSFQRKFVWSIKQSSQLIESFLLGLPVPQVFFYIDDENKNLVIDGQQRLLSIVFFFEGYFGFENLQGRRQVFRLTDLAVDSPYLGKRFVDLTQSDQRRLKNAVLRAVNIRQLAPANQATSIYHIFERLNTGGTPLTPQEIRNCVFRGKIVEILNDLNEYPSWRKILGKKSLDKHQRDVEMLLRIFAMQDRAENYKKPMKEFLNQAMKDNRKNSGKRVSAFEVKFKKVVDQLVKMLPEKPFHVRGPINLAALDSTLSILIQANKALPEDLPQRFKRMLADKTYQAAIFYDTSDASVVKDRLMLAKKFLIS